jgi:hypothetical protein
VFVVLGGIQIVATALIMLCASRYKDTPCLTHTSGRPTAGAAAHGGHDAALRAPVPVLHPHAHAATEFEAAHLQERT